MAEKKIKTKFPGIVGKAFNKSAPNKKLNKFFAYAAAYIVENLYRVFRKRSHISIESIQSAYKTLEYSNEKVKKRFDHNFYSIEETIENAVKGRFR